MLLHIPDVLTAAEITAARARLLQARWIDGQATTGHLSTAVKRNAQLDARDPLAVELGQVIVQRLLAHDTFFAAALPLRILPPYFNRYEGGQAFGFHVDNAIRYEQGQQGPRDPLRTDLSATLFFSDPHEYDGGELEIDDTFGQQRVKLPAGHLVLYPSSSLHRVTPVTRGCRLASFMWVQSMVRDDGDRRLLLELDVAIRRLSTDMVGHPAITSLTGVYHNLLRKWADV